MRQSLRDRFWWILKGQEARGNGADYSRGGAGLTRRGDDRFRTYPAGGFRSTPKAEIGMDRVPTGSSGAGNVVTGERPSPALHRPVRGAFRMKIARTGGSSCPRLRNTPQRADASDGTVGLISIGSRRPDSPPDRQNATRTLRGPGPRTS